MKTKSENREERMEESKQLILEIKRVCERLGWSQRDLAEKLYIELNDDDNEKSIKAFSSAFMKRLQRSTTHPDQLKKYLSIISRLPEFQKANMVRNQYIPLGHLSDFIQKEILDISRDLDRKLHDAEIEKDCEK